MTGTAGPDDAVLHLLVVEDNPADAALVRAHLRRSELADAHVDEAATLRAAIALVARHDVDVVLLDLGLPDADGLEAVEALLARGDAPPVVVLSGNADERTAVSAVATGAQDYLVKGSFDAATLTRVVRYAIERGRALRALRGLEAELVVDRNRLVEAQRIARLGSWSYDPRPDEFVLGPEAAGIVSLEPGCHALDRLVEHVHDDDRSELVETFRSALAGRAGAAILRWTTDAGRRYLHLRAEPVDEDRRVHGTVQDVTDREEAASERDVLMTRLEHAQRLESLGRLAGGIAHNFNNLLAAMSLQAEMLLDGAPEGSTARADIEELMTTIERATALTRQLLVFGRARDTPIETFPVNDAVRDLRSLLDQVIGETVQIELDLDPDAGSIAADRNQIDQALVNLAINARDAIDGDGRVVIKTSNPDADHVEIAVIDDGSGMTEEVRSQALEPFFTTKTADRGTGLGLSIVHGSITQAGGTVGIQSAPGRGTTVALRFPAAVSPATVVELVTPRPDDGGDASDDGVTVLVVDDQPTIVSMVGSLLRRRGFTVLTATSASDVLDTLATGTTVDVVVSDLVMPGMSGRDLVLEIRRHRPSIGVVLMSGYSDGLLLDDELAAEHLTFLGKPFTGAELHDAVHRAMGRPTDATVGD